MKNVILILFLVLTGFSLSGQASFPGRCVGQWQGQMSWWAGGVLRDTVPVSMEIHPLTDTTGWSWKTVYHTAREPIEKDYRLLPDPDNATHFLLDEGDGIILHCYVFGERMYSLFEVNGSLIHSCYTLESGQLIFELTAGSESDMTAQDIMNFSVGTLQRSVFTRK